MGRGVGGGAARKTAVAIVNQHACNPEALCGLSECPLLNCMRQRAPVRCPAETLASERAVGSAGSLTSEQPPPGAEVDRTGARGVGWT
eukprot:7966367-Alexandrium_andersonii.AAC.1